MPRKTIPINSFAGKVLVAAFALIATGSSVLAAKWCFANSIATQAAHIEVAELAVQMAPDDPQTHYALAVLTEKTFLPGDLERSLSEFQTATMLSPHDFRLWLALGKAFERAGNYEKAALSLKNAGRLAPGYAQIAWVYGNFLLRTGETEKAFLQIRRAAESDKKYLRPAIATAFQTFGGDLKSVRNIFGESAELNAVLAASLAGEKKFDEALEIWNSLPEPDRRQRFAEEGAALFRQLLDAKRFNDAQLITNQISAQDEQKFEPEKIYNGGFEADLRLTGASPFEWNLSDGLQPQVLFDTGQKREGNRSIVLQFNSIDGKDFRSLSQNIVVVAGSSYSLSFSSRAQLRSTATFLWQIVDPSGNILTESEPVAAETDWTNHSIEFIAPQDTQAVSVRLARAKCPDGLCPISGRIWFDNFILARSSAGRNSK